MGAASAYPDAAAEPLVRPAQVLPAEFCLSNPHAVEPRDGLPADPPGSDDWEPDRVPGKALPVPSVKQMFGTAAASGYSEAAAADRLGAVEAAEALPVPVGGVPAHRELRTEHRCPRRDFRVWDAQQGEQAAADQRSPVQDGTRSEHRDPDRDQERFAAGLGRPIEQAGVYPDRPDGQVVVAVFREPSLRAGPMASEMPAAMEVASWKCLVQSLAALRSLGSPEQVPLPEAELLAALAADHPQAAAGELPREAGEAVRGPVAPFGAPAVLHRRNQRPIAETRRPCPPLARRRRARLLCACRREVVCRRWRRVRTLHSRLRRGCRQCEKCSGFLQRLCSYRSPRFRCGFAVVVAPNRQRRRELAGS